MVRVRVRVRVRVKTRARAKDVGILRLVSLPWRLGPPYPLALALSLACALLQVPYLVDPNSGTEMFESDDIVNYMLDTYGPPRDAYNDLVLWLPPPNPTPNSNPNPNPDPDPNPNPNPSPSPTPNPNQVLWPLRGAFMTTTATFATLFRGLAGSKRQANARPDNEEMLPLELWGYEPSPFVRPG